MHEAIELSSPIPEDGWKSAPHVLENGIRALRNYTDVSRALKDPRFLSVPFYFPGNPRLVEQCPWFRLKKLVGMDTKSPLLRLYSIIKKSFIYDEGDLHERLQPPIKKLFINRLPAVYESLPSSAEKYLADVSGFEKTDWVERVIRPYISDAVGVLFDFPDGLKPDLHAWFRPRTLDAVFGINSNHPRKNYEAFEQAADFIGRCIKAPGLKKTQGMMAGICSLSQKPYSFTDDEIRGNLLFFMAAASFSTPRTLRGILRTLFTRPDLIGHLRKNPAGISSSLQELLRTHSPVPLIQRQMGQDVLIRDTLLKKGDWVYLDLNAGNRDADVFKNPETINLERSPNPHLAFGWGSHFCLGAPMARTQLEIFLATLVRQNHVLSFETSNEEPLNPDAETLWVQRRS